MREALFIFDLAAAGGIVLAYLTVVAFAMIRGTRLDGCGWLVVTGAAGLITWTLLHFAGQMAGVAIPSPWL